MKVTFNFDSIRFLRENLDYYRDLLESEQSQEKPNHTLIDHYQKQIDSFQARLDTKIAFLDDKLHEQKRAFDKKSSI
jgi:hypothetical protein